MVALYILKYKNMSSCNTEHVRKIVIGRHTDWIKRFEVGDYVQNAPLIEKLHEEKQLALVRNDDLEKQVKQLEIKLHALELEYQAKGIKLLEASRNSTFSFFLSLLAAILLGIGVNLATSTPQGRMGWVMIAAACAVEITAFLIKPEGKKSDG